LFVNKVDNYFKNMAQYKPELTNIMTQKFEIIKLD